VKEFEPDFFIVSLGHGQPKTKNDYNILKNYDYPGYNRSNKKAPTKQDYKDYIKRHKKDPNPRKFSSFNFLVYIADLIDIDTA
jgi:hypothetical protein